MIIILKLIFDCISSAFLTAAGKHTGIIRIKHFYPKRQYILHYCWDKGFKGNIVIQAMPSLPGGSFKITRIVPLVK